MKKLDLYILKKLLSTFLFVVMILLAVITVVDIAENIDKYAENNLPVFSIIKYYASFMPWIGGLITPITTFIATVFVTAKMATHTEIIAMLSSGMSFKRLMVPYLIGACLIAGASFVLNGWIIPQSNKAMIAFKVQYLKGNYSFDQRDFHVQEGPDTYLYMRSYNNESNTGYSFTIEKIRDNQLVEKLSAQTIQWDPYKKKWELKDWVRVRTGLIFDSLTNTTSTETFREVGSAPLDTALSISPEEFRNDYRKFDGMTITELDKYINTLVSRGASGIDVYRVEKYTRYAQPFTILILTFMGVIVSSRKSRGGTGYQIALGFLLSFIFILFFVMFRTFAEAGALPPAISVWVPSFIFGALSLLMYKYVPR